MNVVPSPDDRLTAFGNQLVATHLRLREDLATLRDGGVPARDLRTHCLAFCEALTRLAAPDAGRLELDSVAALLETHLVYEDKQLVALLNTLTPDTNSTDATSLTRGTTL